MMKKKGFTLAEVLITLTIIGVVAMMTLPALMTNVQEQQAKTGLKKGINTLTEAAQMNMATVGFGYADLKEQGDALTADRISQEQSLRGLMLNRAQVDTRLSEIDMTGTVNPQELRDYMRPENNPIFQGASLFTPDSVITFRDGSSLLYSTDNSFATDDNTVLQADGLPLGFLAVYDINGLKGPNQISNCVGEINIDKDNDYEEFAPSATTCNQRNHRIIKDQFFVRLRGASVTPGSAAAKWVMDN